RDVHRFTHINTYTNRDIQTHTHRCTHVHPLGRARILTIFTVTIWEENHQQHKFQEQHCTCRCSFFLLLSQSLTSFLTNLPHIQPSLLTSFSTHQPSLSLCNNANVLLPQPWMSTQTLSSPPGLTLLSGFQLLLVTSFHPAAPPLIQLLQNESCVA
ncbi:unnamed protein product, partial [Gulo gulo]